MGFLRAEEIEKIGLKSFGKNVLISDKVSFYNAAHIEIGSNVRIDDYCILSGNIEIGNHIHISAYCALYGNGGIRLKDFSGLSPRCTLLSVSDDFSGRFMIGPHIPDKYTNVDKRKISIERYVQVGANAVILPGVCISEGSVIGAMSLVKENVEEWLVCAGNPLKFIKHRQKDMLSYVKEFIGEK